MLTAFAWKMNSVTEVLITGILHVQSSQKDSCTNVILSTEGFSENLYFLVYFSYFQRTVSHITLCSELGSYI
jgi:hypothetical protein